LAPPTLCNNEVRLQLHAPAYNLANFMRTLALPEEVEHWSLTTLREKLVKIGAEIVRHGRYVTFQLAEVAVPRKLFLKILELINDLRRRPVPTQVGIIDDMMNMTGEVCSDDDKIGQMGLQRRPNHQIETVGWAQSKIPSISDGIRLNLDSI
jgi:hypothetical protein